MHGYDPRAQIEWGYGSILGDRDINEHEFLEAVTGNKLSFADGMEIGRKIWNLDNSIWTLQGRHRDMVHFPEYIYSVPYTRYGAKGKFAHYYLPGRVGP